MSVIAEPHQTRLPLWRQLRWSLVLMFFVLVIVPIIVIAYITLTQIRQTTEDQVIGQLESVAELKTQAIDRWIATGQESLVLTLANESTRSRFWLITDAEDTSGIVGTTIELLNTLLAESAQSHEGVEEYYYYDVNEGIVVVASNPERIDQRVQDEPYFLASLAEPHVQPPYNDATGKLVMVVTSPVVSANGSIIGVLAAQLNLETLSTTMLERAGLGETGETYLVSAQNNTLLTASRFEGYEPDQEYHSRGIDRALERVNGSGIYEGYRETRVIGVYRWIDDLQAALIAEIEHEEALQGYNDVQNQVALLTAFLALIAVAIGVFVATRFSTPIVALTRTASQFAGGDFSARAQTQQRNEIGVLSSAFNDMADQIQALVGTLESRVEARTRDLFLTLEVGQLATRIYQQEDLLPLITEYIRQQFGLYYTQVYLLDEAGHNAVLSAGTGEVGRQLMDRGHRLDLRETSIVARTVQTQRPVLVENTATSDVFRPNPLLPETRSEVAIPLIVGDEVLGVLDMQANQANAFREDNLPVFEAMGSQLASALRSAQAYAETQAVVERSNTIARRLTAEAWESYLGRVGSGERVGYRYNLQRVEPLPADTASDGDGDKRGMLSREMKLRDQVIGRIALGEDSDRTWTPAEIALVDSVAERVAAALDQFRAFDDTRAALDRVDLIMESAGEGIYGLDRDGYVIFANAAASVLDGYDTNDLIGQHHHTLLHHTHHDGTPYPEEDCPVYATLQDGVARTSDNEMFWRKDGTSFPVELAANAILEEGEVTGVVVTFRDISERLEAQTERERLLAETQRRAAEMETVAQVGTEAAGTLNIENLLWNVSDLTKERFGLYHAHIYLLDDAGQYLVLTAGAGQPGRRMVNAGHRIASSHERSLVARAARSGEAVLVEDVTTAEDFLPNPLLPETRSEMAIPLVVSDTVIGVLDVQSEESGRFSAQDVQVLGTLASQVAIAVNNARLFTETQRLLADSQRRATEMETVAEVGAEASASLDLQQLLSDVVELTKERFGFYHVHIYLTDQIRENLVLTAGSGQPGQLMLNRGHSIPVDRQGSLVARAARSGGPVRVNDVRQSDDFLPNPLLPRTRSEMAVPMVVGGQVIGVLDVQSDMTDAFDEQEAQVLGTLASQVAIAVNNARLFTETQRLLADSQRRATEMETVAEVGAEASASLDLQQLLTDVVELTKERFDLYHAHIYLTDEAGENLVLTAGSGQPGQLMLNRGHSIPVDRQGSLVARAARSGGPVRVNDVRQSDDFLPNPLLPRTRSEMAVPMVVGGQVIGVLDVQSDMTDAFDEQEAQVLGTLASQIAVAVQNARLFAEQVEVTDQLREVDRLKSEFLASMSHELRTPLNSIIGYAEVLLDGIDGELTDDMEEDVGAIHGSGKHLLNLINDILDLAKIEAGQMDLVTEVLPLRPLIEDTANSARVFVMNKEVQLIIDIPDDLPPVYADPLRIRQIVNNFVSNAAKFTEEGRITVWAKPYEEDPTMIHVAVQDTGIGMSQDQLDVIFDRFRQVDQSHTRRAGGTGLGLSITLQLIEMHGGTVWVESEPNIGSTFHFTLPRATKEQIAADSH